MVAKAKVDLEANRHLDTSAEREQLEAMVENWNIKERTVPLRNAEKVKLEIHLSWNGMSRKTFINANTTEMNFADPGETVTVKGPSKSMSVDVPKGAKQILIEKGALRIIM